MPVVTLIIVTVVLLVVLSLVAYYLAPRLPAPFGNIAIVVTVLLIILWLLSAVGVLPPLAGMRVGG